MMVKISLLIQKLCRLYIQNNLCYNLMYVGQLFSAIPCTLLPNPSKQEVCVHSWINIY